MSGELRVFTAHLRELAAKQGKAAAEIRSATDAAEDVDTSIRTTHGLIAWSTAAAVETVQHARRGAGTGMEGVSEGMAADLQDAATTYDWSDEMARVALGDQMHAR